VLLDSAGLSPSAEACAPGRRPAIDGPFSETKEVAAGCAMLQAASMDEALAITRRFLAVHGDDWELECEVRQVTEHCTEAG
jgi:hypothetical protein